MWRTRLRSFIEIGTWERCLKSGELKSMWRTHVRSFIEIGAWEKFLISEEPYSLDDGKIF